MVFRVFMNFALISLALLPRAAAAEMPFRSHDPNFVAPPPPPCPVAKLSEIQLTRTGLERYVEKNCETIQSVDTLLSCLPESFLRKRAFYYGSQSQQPSDRNFPRVVLGSKRSLLTLGFSCHPGHPGAKRSVEMIFHNEASNENEFQELKLGEGLGCHAGFKVGGLNPHTCERCHGSQGNRRHIVDSYPLWPGAYGGDDVLIFRPRTDAQWDDYVLRKKLPIPHSIAQEERDFGDFWTSRWRHECYRQLPEPAPNDAFLTTEYQGLSTMSSELVAINLKRVLAKVKKTPRNQALSLLLLGTMACPNDFDFPATRTWEYQRRAAEFEAAAAANYDRNDHYLGFRNGRPELRGYGLVAHELRALTAMSFMLDESGIDHSELILSFDRYSGNIHSGTLSQPHFYVFAQELSARLNAGRPRIPKGGASDNDELLENCTRLRQFSIAAFPMASTWPEAGDFQWACVQLARKEKFALPANLEAKLADAALVEATRKAAIVFEKHRCESCHAQFTYTNSRGTLIHFENPQKLNRDASRQIARNGAVLLADEIVARVKLSHDMPGAMPGTKQGLNSDEIKILEQWARALKATLN